MLPRRFPDSSVFWGGRFLRLEGFLPEALRELGERHHPTPKMPAASVGQASTVSEEWPRALPDLSELLEQRFYLLDWFDGYITSQTEYNRFRAATCLAELRTPFVRGGGHKPSALLMLSGKNKPTIVEGLRCLPNIGATASQR